MATICPTCGKSVRWFQLTTVHCDHCRRPIHAHGLLRMLDLEQLQAGKIAPRIFCLRCQEDAETEARRLAAARYCPQCHRDLSAYDDEVPRVAQCGRCRTTVCTNCGTQNAQAIFQMVPEALLALSLLSRFSHLCQECQGATARDTEAAVPRMMGAIAQPIVIYSGGMKDYAVVRECGPVRFETDPDTLFNEEKAKDRLLHKALKAGGNAVYDYRKIPNEREVIRGYSKNGNPYCGTEYTRILTGRAVLHRRKS
jgi:hypothetical protein